MARMHQTTVRFGPDLWAALQGEAERAGVSVAQFVRDAAVARLAFADGIERGRSLAVNGPRLAGEQAPRLVRQFEAEQTSIEALRAQGQLARDRSRRLRAEAETLRDKAIERVR